MIVAVLTDPEGETCGLDTDGVIKVFGSGDNGWTIHRKREYVISGVETPGEMRKYLAETAEWLGDCKNFIAKRIRGVHIAAFEGFSMSFWQIPGRPEEFLDALLEKYPCSAKHHGRPPQIPIKPIEQKPGFYHIDLRGVMKPDIALNSKDVLRPFFKQTPFQQLEIICEHLPKWFEYELPGLKLKYEIQERDDRVIVFVSPVTP